MFIYPARRPLRREALPIWPEYAFSEWAEKGDMTYESFINLSMLEIGYYPEYQTVNPFKIVPKGKKARSVAKILLKYGIVNEFTLVTRYGFDSTKFNTSFMKKPFDSDIQTALDISSRKALSLRQPEVVQVDSSSTSCSFDTDALLVDHAPESSPLSLPPATTPFASNCPVNVLPLYTGTK